VMADKIQKIFLLDVPRSKWLKQFCLYKKHFKGLFE